MKKIFLFTFSLLIITFNCFSQSNHDIKRTYHWYFGGKAGLDFSSGSPIVDTSSKMDVYAGCATMSDTAGNLLMYTDGFKVWNREHNIMPNGTGLAMTNSTPYQSSIIIPKPGKDNNHLYYIFHLTAHNFKDTLIRGLQYSIVDMTLDSGRGDVTIKGQMLLTPVSEALGAVYHANCEDVWVMAHKRGTNCFYAFLLTENGITDTVINNIGNFAGTPYGAYGLKFSPDGSRMASSAFWDIMNPPYPFDTLHLFDFNRQNGVLSHPILIPDSCIGSYGFSPDNKKIYIHVGAHLAYTYQCDITSNDYDSIMSTYQLLIAGGYWDHADFQNAADGSIIATKILTKYVDVITSPDLSGTSCNLISNAIYLGGRYCYISLPNFIQSYFDTDSTTNCLSSIVNEDNTMENKVNIYPNPFYYSATVIIQEKINNQEDISLTLYDLSSRKANISHTIHILGNSIEIELSRNLLSEGIYFLNINLPDKNLTTKIIIIN